MPSLNALLVVYSFPPAGGVGVLRAASLARYLPGEDIRLDVLTTHNASAVGTDPSLLWEIPAQVTIHRTLAVDLPFGLKKMLKRMLTGSKPPGGPATSQPRALSPQKRPGFLQRLSHFALLPDPQVLWLPILTRAASRIVRQRSIDAVVITGAPYSTFLLAKRLRAQFPGLRIVLDFRDEWLTTSFGIASFAFNTSERARHFAIRAEAEAVASADLVVAVTEYARREIRSRYPGDPEEKFQLVPNGFDATRIQVSAPANRTASGRRNVVTYVGTLYTSTQPGPLIEALRSLPPETRARYTFRFVGHIEEPAYRAALLELGDLVEWKGYMSQREALQQVAASDYVLLISHDRLNISAKFYDYLGAQKPILACIHPQGDIRRLLEELRAGWWADSEDVDAMRQLFVDAASRMDSLAQDFRPDLEKIARYERKPLAQGYAALLKSIAIREPGKETAVAEVL